MLQKNDGYVTENPDKKLVNMHPDPRVRAALWHDYKHNEIRLPKEYVDKLDEFNRILESPILPKECSALLESYLSTVRNNTNLIGELLTNCAEELPRKYPTHEQLLKGTYFWIANKYNQDFEHLEPKAKEILEFVRNYWTVNDLL